MIGIKHSTFGNRGFTLIELILSSVILAIIGVYTWLSMDASFRTQRTMQRYSRLQEIGHGVSGKIAMDISQSFYVVRTPPITFFQAKGGEVQFTSLGHANASPTARESELTEITYKTESNPRGRNLMLLQRRETSYIDGPVENIEDAPFYTLTDALSSIEWEFSTDGIRFVKTWDTTTNENRDQLPKLVRLSFTLSENGEIRDDPKEASFTSLIDIPLSLMAQPQTGAAQGQNANGSNNENPNQPNTPGSQPQPAGRQR
jgi:prepilin-type N-terminal cleavage/methylation domain-containing protein